MQNAERDEKKDQRHCDEPRGLAGNTRAHISSSETHCGELNA